MPVLCHVFLWAEQLEPWLTTQFRTEKQHILLAEDWHIFLTCLQLVGTWVPKNQEFGPTFVDMSSASGDMGANYFQESVPSVFLFHVLS